MAGRFRVHGWLVPLATCLFGAGCGAVYPELSAPVRPAPTGRELKPPPPDDLLYIAFKGAEIPATTRDGRKWDSLGNAAPDAFATLSVDGKELIKTPVHANTLKPTWPDQKRANYQIKPGSRIRVELWEANPINNHPICVKNLQGLHDGVTSGSVEIECDSGATISLAVERAHAKLGIGMYYELRTQEIYVTRVLSHSPASRAGIVKGDQVVRIQSQEVKKLDEAEARSLINANAGSGLALTIRRADGSVADLTVQDGPIYPAVDESIPID
jgi:hypothetical protein